MADDKTKRGPQDAARVNPKEAYEVNYLAKELGVTPQKVKEAEKAVGPMRTKVIDYIKKHNK